MPGTLFCTMRKFARGIRITDPVIETAPLERVMDFARAIGCDDDDRRMRGFHRSHFRDRHLKVGEHFKEKRLERFIGAVELVDQQHGGAGGIGLQRLQQWPLDEKAFGEDIVLKALTIFRALGLAETDGDHLRGVIPFIDGGRDIEPFIALQPDQPSAERLAQDLGDLGLADAGLPLEE